jgi:hypothetical protein
MTMSSRTVSSEEAAAVAENIELKARVVELETIIADLTQDSVPGFPPNDQNDSVPKSETTPEAVDDAGGGYGGAVY